MRCFFSGVCDGFKRTRLLESGLDPQGSHDDLRGVAITGRIRDVLQVGLDPEKRSELEEVEKFER